MVNERYPSDLVVTKDDFAKSGWKSILEKSIRDGYSAMWSAFSREAQKAMEEGNQSKGKVLWLLADACSMMLKPDKLNEPYKPMAVMADKRSALPDDFIAADIAFFAEIIDQIDDPWLKGRLADLVWLCGQPRTLRFALTTIDAYRQLALDTETWIRGSQECWGRAIRLALMLGRGSGSRLSEMESSILAAFNKATINDGYLALWLADLVYEHHLARDRTRSIAEHVKRLATEFDKAGDLHRGRDYFDRAAAWFRRAGDVSRNAEMTVAVAEGWIREAEARASADKPSHMVAASFYENAIQVYRTVPRSERSSHRVDERIAELRERLNDAGERSLEEMGVISTPRIDITQLVDEARNLVRGKTATDAMAAFANLNRLDAKAMRDSAIQTAKEHPLANLFAATMFSRDGRMIAKHSGMGLGDSSISDNEGPIWAQMVRDYGIMIGLVVQGSILPALETICQEHHLREADLVGLANCSPIVPKDRARLFGKALFAGFDYDFVTAIHLLAPQIENMVRVHLKAAGVKTTTLDQNGIETENGLSTLIALPEAQKVLGPDLSFEIRALYCDAFGANLRNEIAHGLISDESCQSMYIVYAWWLGLRLVFNTYWNAARKQSEKTGEEETS